jgi:hypothetical protein
VRLRDQFPQIRTELITHARHVDPLGLARLAGASSVSIEWDMFDPADADALHSGGIAVRLTFLPQREVALRSRYGFNDERRLKRYLSCGHIDALSGDDVGYIGRIVVEARQGRR